MRLARGSWRGRWRRCIAVGALILSVACRAAPDPDGHHLNPVGMVQFLTLPATPP